MSRFLPLIASLVLAGCASSTQPLILPTKHPPLDSRLAEPCQPIKKPAADYDAWLQWAMDLVGQYGDCAARHRETVAAWPQ